MARKTATLTVRIAPLVKSTLLDLAAEDRRSITNMLEKLIEDEYQRRQSKHRHHKRGSS